MSNFPFDECLECPAYLVCVVETRHVFRLNQVKYVACMRAEECGKIVLLFMDGGTPAAQEYGYATWTTNKYDVPNVMDVLTKEPEKRPALEGVRQFDTTFEEWDCPIKIELAHQGPESRKALCHECAQKILNGDSWVDVASKEVDYRAHFNHLFPGEDLPGVPARDEEDE